MWSTHHDGATSRTDLVSGMRGKLAPFTRMFDRYQTFKPVEGYKDTEFKHHRYFEYSHGLRIHSSLLAEIILADYRLRFLTQSQDACLVLLAVLKKRPFQEGDSDLVQELEQGIMMARSKIGQEVRRNYWDYELKLPQFPLKEIYDKTRENPTWYLRKELVQDCIASGGCCGQKCKCCDTRHVGRERMKGLGHCTDGCLCCLQRVDFEWTDKETEDLHDTFAKSLFSRNPAPLLTLAEAYFTLPNRSGLGSSSLTRAIAWRKKNPVSWQWKRVAGWLK